MTPIEFGVFVISLLIAVTGQFFLKLGALKLGRVTPENMIGHALSIITTPELLGGLAFYGLSAITYILLLTRVKLSVIGPSVALSYVLSVVVGYFVFRESIPPMRLVGLGFIVCGVLLVVWQKP